jgi:hypothetical protein
MFFSFRKIQDCLECLQCILWNSLGAKITLSNMSSLVPCLVTCTFVHLILHIALLRVYFTEFFMLSCKMWLFSLVNFEQHCWIIKTEIHSVLAIMLLSFIWKCVGPSCLACMSFIHCDMLTSEFDHYAILCTDNCHVWIVFGVNMTFIIS